MGIGSIVSFVVGGLDFVWRVGLFVPRLLAGAGIAICLALLFLIIALVGGLSGWIVNVMEYGNETLNREIWNYELEIDYG